MGEHIDQGSHVDVLHLLEFLLGTLVDQYENHAQTIIPLPLELFISTVIETIVSGLLIAPDQQTLLVVVLCELGLSCEENKSRLLFLSRKCVLLPNIKRDISVTSLVGCIQLVWLSCVETCIVKVSLL
ncbi:hypothetical protein TNCV_2415041 [Trichonephila clavipes]|nr:hypothetical protein TNCV_2415041 [Trichonephila clavipes]